MDQFEFDFEVQDTTANEDHNVAFGDVWILGRHVLKCGDSCSDLDVQDLMGGDLADMVFTDPPYGMGKEAEGVSNDNLNQSDLLAFNKIWIPISLNYLKQNGSWYCWGKDEPLMDIYSEIIKPLKNERAERKITFCNLLTWDKGRGAWRKKQHNAQVSAAFGEMPFHHEGQTDVRRDDRGLLGGVRTFSPALRC